MTEFDPSQGRPENGNGRILEGRVVRPDIIPTRPTGNEYDPLDAAESYSLISPQDHAEALARQDRVAKRELKEAIEGRKNYYHTPARHPRPDAPIGVRPDQAGAMRTVKQIRSSRPR